WSVLPSNSRRIEFESVTKVSTDAVTITPNATALKNITRRSERLWPLPWFTGVADWLLERPPWNRPLLPRRDSTTDSGHHARRTRSGPRFRERAGAGSRALRGTAGSPLDCRHRPESPPQAIVHLD